MIGPMDESPSAGEATPAGPDAETVAALRARLPEELSHLPVTSAAEYRQEAWKAHYTRPQPSGTYHPTIGFRGLGAGMTGLFSIGGLWMLLTGQMTRSNALENILLLVFLIAATALLAWSKVVSNRKADRLQARNRVLSDVSKRIDQEVAAGRIPLTPPGWQGTILAPL